MGDQLKQNDVYDVQIDNNSDFSSPLIDETQWSETTVVTMWWFI